MRAIGALGALAHDHRMAVFRLLVRAGPPGLAAGDIAAQLDMPPSSLSFHLSQLTRAGLLRTWRVSRHVFYAVDFPAMRGLLDFLMEDCCAGAPEICCPPPGGAARASSGRPDRARRAGRPPNAART